MAIKNTIYATADFLVSGIGWDEAPYEATVHATLETSGAFDYGNGTCMGLKWSDQPRTKWYDTRYCKVNKENFTRFAKSQLESEVLDTIKVEVIDEWR